MAVAKIQLPDGRIATLEVPDGTTSEQVEAFVRDNPDQFQQEQPEQSFYAGLRDKMFGGAEAALSVASGAAAMPASGVAGIVQAVNPFADPGAGARAVEGTRDALTYRPRTESGQEALSAVGDALEPVGNAISSAENWLGDAAFEATGSPAVAAAAKTAPTALMEVLGLGAAKAATRTKRAGDLRKMDDFMAQSAPTSDALKDTARTIYKEIDDLGVRVKADAYTSLASKISRQARKQGLDSDITPAANKAVNRFNELIGGEVSLSELDTLRKVAKGAADSLNKTEQALGNMIISSVDEFLDKGGRTILTGADAGLNIGKRYKVARDLWGRARRSELIDEAMTKADLQASGLENGIRIQFRSILNNPKKRNFFTRDEISEMNKVVQGTKGANLAKLLGRFGFSEGNATNIVGGSIGSAVGASVGSAVAGPAGAYIGAIAAASGGTLSRRLAQRLTKDNAKFAQSVIRAGKDGRKITQAYLANTPKAERSARELSELLVNTDIALDLIGGDGMAKRAADLAKARRAELATAATTGSAKEGGMTRLTPENAQ